MIGFLISNAENQQMVHNINELSKTNKNMVFSSTIVPSLQTNVMQRYEAFHFNGTIITSDFRLSQQLLHHGS